MLFILSASADKCDLLNPNGCGLYDCGGNSWSPDETEGNGDNLSLRSGLVNMIGSSKVCMKVRGPGLVKFMWRMDQAAQSVGILSFLVDNSPARVCNSQRWAPVSYSLRDDKDYVISWQFQKIKSYPEGVGAGWIDDLEAIGGKLGMPSETISGTLIGRPDYNMSSANRSNWTVLDRSNYTWPDRSCNSCDERKNNGTFINEASCGYTLSQAPIIVPAPNITIKIELNPKTDFNINIHDDSSSNIMTNSSNLPPSINVYVGQDGNTTTGGGSNSNRDESKTDVCVCQNKSIPGCYDSINKAIKEVNEDGYVTVYSGTYLESVVIDKSLRLKGENNNTTKIVAKDRDGVAISSGKNISIEDLCIINENNSRKKAIGINISSENLNFTLKNCSVADFAIGVKLSKVERLILVGNNISSSIDLENECKYCSFKDGCKISARHNFTAGLWLVSSCKEDIVIKENTFYLVNKSNLHTFGIMCWNIAGDCYGQRINSWSDPKNNSFAIEPTCKIMQLTGQSEKSGLAPDCSCKRTQNGQK
jgi:hypothetical protein